MKLGVICDGISRDLAYTLSVMDEFDLSYAELQYVWDKEVGDHSKEEIEKINVLLQKHNKSVSCLSRHIFSGLTSKSKPGDVDHQKHMDALKRVADMAHTVQSPLVRIMTNKKEQILWGSHGAENWNITKGGWSSLAPLIEPAVDLAKKERLQLVVETGNGTMVNSSYTARKLIDELNAKDTLKVLWDPGNNCWCHELAYPDGYNELKDGYIGHIHIKDLKIDTPRAFLEITKIGEGHLGPLLKPIAKALKKDNYQGSISLESIFHFGDNNTENGFRANIEKFKESLKNWLGR